jgi:cytoskeletal protein CcmA (bactofilin family)
MSSLDLDFTPEPAPVSAAVLAARHRRALVAGLGGGRSGDARGAQSSGAERRLSSPATGPARAAAPWPTAATAALAPAALATAPPSEAPRPRTAPAVAGVRLQVNDALVVPAGVLIRGYVRCRALLLAGDIVGNVHCTGGPVVIRSGASLEGRLVSSGDVYVRGTVADGGGGAVISTAGKLTLAPGARVDGDVRSARLDRHEGSTLHGAAKGCED